MKNNLKKKNWKLTQKTKKVSLALPQSDMKISDKRPWVLEGKITGRTEPKVADELINKFPTSSTAKENGKRYTYAARRGSPNKSPCPNTPVARREWPGQVQRPQEWQSLLDLRWRPGSRTGGEKETSLEKKCKRQGSLKPGSPLMSRNLQEKFPALPEKRKETKIRPHSVPSTSSQDLKWKTHRSDWEGPKADACNRNTEEAEQDCHWGEVAWATCWLPVQPGYRHTVCVNNKAAWRTFKDYLAWSKV